MEFKLTDGKYSVGEGGRLETVGGAQEAAQRVLARLTARRGGFSPLPGFGGRLFTLPSAKPAQWASLARKYIAEALADEKDITIEDVAVVELEPGRVSVSVRLRYESDTISLTTVV